LIILLAGCTMGVAPLGDGDLGVAAGHCRNQDDCPNGTICQPAPLGTAIGTCVPPSTRHCAACTSDADCGSDAICFQPPGDVAPGCHVDCSLSWLACPSGYNCSSVMYQGGMRRVCLPAEYRCADVGGGSCNSGDTQPCTRTNAAGTCMGVRTCLNGQYGACGAPEPAYLDHCGDKPPAGCTALPSAAALSVASDCGACGNSCPGSASSTADVACVDPSTSTCGISCRGDNYDIDGSAANGCEVADPDAANHVQSAATAFPSTDCSDSSSQNSFGGLILSDTRPHLNPAVAAFDAKVGAAPHWFSVYSSGGALCEDDFALSLTVTGGGAVPCYTATILTDKTSSTITATGSGSASSSGPAGSYSDGSTIYFKVEKTCSTASVGGADVMYTVSYHL
jgi:hypothetical protein